MKIGRGEGTVSLRFEDAEYDELERLFGRVPTRHAVGRLDVKQEVFRVKFGDGYSLYKNANMDGRYLALPIDTCNANTLEMFGLTPTVFTPVSKYVIEVKIPEIKAPLRRRNARKIAAKSAFDTASSTTFEVPLPSFNAVAKKSTHSPYRSGSMLAQEPDDVLITEEELVDLKRLWNKAIDQGWVPSLDAKPHIIYMARREQIG